MGGRLKSPSPVERIPDLALAWIGGAAGSPVHYRNMLEELEAQLATLPTDTIKRDMEHGFEVMAHFHCRTAVPAV